MTASGTSIAAIDDMYGVLQVHEAKARCASVMVA